MAPAGIEENEVQPLQNWGLRGLITFSLARPENRLTGLVLCKEQFVTVTFAVKIRTQFWQKLKRNTKTKSFLQQNVTGAAVYSEVGWCEVLSRRAIIA